MKSKYFETFLPNELEFFDKFVKDGFPGAVGHITPDFDSEPKIEVRRWGDRRHEECPKDLNEALYNLWYKVRIQKHWNPDKRNINMSHDILEVSVDGENWRAANSKEQEGWDNGGFYIAKHRHEYDEAPDNSYTRERRALERRIHARRDEVAKKRKFSLNFKDTETFADAVDLEIAQIEKEISQLHL